MPTETYIDASLFMGMHARDAGVRRACGAFFAASPAVTMTYEEVGRCDDVVWGYPRETQDAYYPFMDVLHTVLPLHRRPYTETVWQAVEKLPAHLTEGLSVRRRLLLATVAEAGGRLVTVDPRLLALPADGGLPPVQAPPESAADPRFPEVLAGLYPASLALEVDHGTV